MVAVLAERGLIRRERNPGNRREMLIYLTDRGTTLLDGLAGPVRRLEEEMTRDLDPAQLREALGAAWHALSRPGEPVTVPG
jgi:DNA-binding MarR family transcriptional regulator